MKNISWIYDGWNQYWNCIKLNQLKVRIQEYFFLAKRLLWGCTKHRLNHKNITHKEILFKNEILGCSLNIWRLESGTKLHQNQSNPRIFLYKLNSYIWRLESRLKLYKINQQKIQEYIFLNKRLLWASFESQKQKIKKITQTRICFEYFSDRDNLVGRATIYKSIEGRNSCIIWKVWETEVNML